MSVDFSLLSFPRHRRLAACVLLLALAGCTVGPEFVKPTPITPDDWTSWRAADAELRQPVNVESPIPTPWWTVFGDPLLNRLQERALRSSPDLQVAASRFAQARVQRTEVAAQQSPEIGLSGGVNRQRQSEYGSGTRMIDILGHDRKSLAEALSEPFTLYQAGFDASWELDFWGRVRRSIEAADAETENQKALLDLARMSLVSDVARSYFELRTTQTQIRLMRQDIEALENRLQLMEARVRGGVINHLDTERQRIELAANKAKLPALLAQEGAGINQIALLLGEPGRALRDELGAPAPDSEITFPDLALGLPSEVARRRPDIRAAEARLHRTTANIGVAQADLYPSIRLGSRFGFESFLSGEFSNWGSRTWSIGPSLDLPLFDHGRRRSVVQLRELEQQEAAVNYQKTVLKAWQEIDDTLSAYVSDGLQRQEHTARVSAARQAYRLAQAHYDGGTTDFLPVLDAQRSYLQARRDLTAIEGQLATRYVAVNKVLASDTDAE